jgi:hypothetical protein
LQIKENNSEIGSESINIFQERLKEKIVECETLKLEL